MLDRIVLYPCLIFLLVVLFVYLEKQDPHNSICSASSSRGILFQQYFVSFPLCLGRTLVEILPFSDGVTLGVGEMARGGRCAAW